MVSLELAWLPLVTFAISTSITPGPNNIMLTASGANFGFIRSVPHMLGIPLGFLVMYLCVAFGLGSIFILHPELQDWLRYVGSAYLLFLAWKIARGGRIESGAKTARPMTMMQAVLFQFVNVKAVMMAVGCVSVFTLPGEQYTLSAIVVGIVFSLVNLPCVSVWAGFGTVIRRFLKNETSLRVFNGFLALLTAGSVVLLYY